MVRLRFPLLLGYTALSQPIWRVKIGALISQWSMVLLTSASFWLITLSFSLQIAFWHLHLQKDSSQAWLWWVNSVFHWQSRLNLWLSFLWKEELLWRMNNTAAKKIFFLSEAGVDRAWAKCNWSSGCIWFPVLQPQEPFTLLVDQIEDRVFHCSCWFTWQTRIELLLIYTWEQKHCLVSEDRSC